MGLHEDYSGLEEIEGSSDRSFGLVFTAVSWIVGLWPLVFHASPVRLWAIVLGCLFLATSLLKPKVLAPLNRLWFRFGLVLGRIVNPIVMALLFFTTIVPMGIVMRLFGRDGLRLRLDRKVESYWIERKPPGPPPDSMRNQF